MATKCNAIVISAQAEYGNEPVPLFSAGTGKLECVLEVEALATIQLSKAVFSERILENQTPDVSYGGLTIKDAVVKYSLTAQSGDAYFVSSATAVGRKA